MTLIASDGLVEVVSKKGGSRGAGDRDVERAAGGGGGEGGVGGGGDHLGQNGAVRVDYGFERREERVPTDGGS